MDGNSNNHIFTMSSSIKKGWKKCRRNSRWREKERKKWKTRKQQRNIIKLRKEMETVWSILCVLLRTESICTPTDIIQAWKTSIQNFTCRQHLSAFVAQNFYVFCQKHNFIKISNKKNMFLGELWKFRGLHFYLFPGNFFTSHFIIGFL